MIAQAEGILKAAIDSPLAGSLLAVFRNVARSRLNTDGSAELLHPIRAAISAVVRVRTVRAKPIIAS